jgi:hypothetical protein
VHGNEVVAHTPADDLGSKQRLDVRPTALSTGSRLSAISEDGAELLHGLRDVRFCPARRAWIVLDPVAHSR